MMLQRVAFFPSVESLSTNPYWDILRTALEINGIEVEPSNPHVFSRRWLLANRQRVSILHLHYVQQFYAYEGKQARLRWVLRFAAYLLIARYLGYKTVFTMHNLKPTYPLKPEWVDYLGHLVAVNLTDSVIVHCEAARQLLYEHFKRRNHVFIVPHPHYIGIYPNLITKQEARARLELGQDQTVFVFLGGIRPNKGIEFLAEAFKQLHETDLRLVIAGAPWPPPDYIQLLTETIKDDPRIHFIPQHIPDDEMQIYLNAADVFVFPFSSILTSGSTILAMSFGQPVIVPALGCIKELVTPDVGILYSPGDLSSLRSSLRKSTELDLQEMGKCALKKVQSNTWEEIAKQTMLAYRL